MNKKRIRIASVTAVALLTVAMAGCGESNDSQKGSTSASGEHQIATSKETEKELAHLVMYLPQSQYQFGEKNAIQQMLETDIVANMTYLDAAVLDDQSRQGEDLLLNGKQWNQEFHGWNMEMLDRTPEYTVDEDGNLVVTVTLKSDMKWNDGAKVTAEDYCVGYAIFAQGDLNKRYDEVPKWLDGAYFAGYETYQTASMEGDNGVVDHDHLIPFAGVHLLSDTSFSITINKKAVTAEDTYQEVFRTFPMETAVWLPEDVHVLDDGDGIFLSSSARGEKMQTQIQMMLANTQINNQGGVYNSNGAFYVDHINPDQIVLMKNPYQKSTCTMYGVALNDYDVVTLILAEDPKATANAADATGKVVYLEGQSVVTVKE